MRELIFFSREIIVSEGSRRVKEVGYCGVIDADGNLELKKLLGHFYSENKANPIAKNDSPSQFFISKDTA